MYWGVLWVCVETVTQVFSSADKVKLSWPTKGRHAIYLHFEISSKSVLSSVDMIGGENLASLYEV